MARADVGALYLLVLLAVDVVIGERRSRLALASAASRSFLIPARGRRGDEAGSGVGTPRGPARGRRRVRRGDEARSGEGKVNGAGGEVVAGEAKRGGCGCCPS